MRNTVPAILMTALLFAGCKESSVGPHNGAPGEKSTGELYYTAFPDPTNKNHVAVYAVDADGTNKRMIVDQAGIFSSPVGDRFVGTQLPGGKVVRYTTTGAELNIVVHTPVNFAFPVLAPTGGLVAYRNYVSQTGGGSATELHIVQSDGTDNSVIETEAASETIPVWSPDGTKIAYFKQGVEIGGLDRDSLFVVNSNGTGRRLLMAQGVSMNDNYESLDWSPDGTRLACITEMSFQVYEVVVVDAASGAVQRVTFDGLAKAMPVWSPDSRKIAYIGASGPSQMSVFTIEADGTGKRQYVVSENNDIAFPQWSPDGAYVSVTELVDDAYGLLKVIDVGTGAIKTIDNAVYKAYWKK